MIKRFSCGHTRTVKTRIRSGFMVVNVVCPTCQFKDMPNVIKVSHYLEMRVGSKIMKFSYKKR